jgi:hypothetical protein
VTTYSTRSCSISSRPKCATSTRLTSPNANPNPHPNLNPNPDQVRNFNAPHLTSPHLSAANCLEILSSLASAVAKEAVRVGHLQDDPATSTPFSVNAAMEGYQAPGGKLDDVAVVVGLVREGPAEEMWRGELSSNFSK